MLKGEEVSISVSEMVLTISCTLCLAKAGERTYVVEADEEHGQLLCRRCGHEIAGARHLHRRMPSILSLRQRNDTIVGVPGVLIQLFENPAGERFEVVVAEKADVYHGGAAYGDDTWFLGYTWRVAMCPACGAHLGWFYESQLKSHSHSSASGSATSSTDKQSKTSDTFVGLILGNLLSADYDSRLTEYGNAMAAAVCFSQSKSPIR